MLLGAEFFTDDVGNTTADERGGSGPVMEAEDDSGDRGNHAGDLHHYADEFDVRVRGHVAPSEGQIGLAQPAAPLQRENSCGEAIGRASRALARKRPAAALRRAIARLCSAFR